ncbi:hypothetical protein [Paenibacillus antarcticus]|uniref:Lipoprotein n=1 Tax=Paenibacillus antarcticus TaxID=253703 RepID=A0A168QH41_9BACL|nr:hypothetical protein [Paenibacillus antarcticus]OAB47778.1 hypothetical protein PBAT_04595 [Paenibacillus antarcticus]
MNKKFTAIVLTMLLAMTVVLSGCGSKQDPKEALQSAAGNAMTMTSYEMKSKLVIEELIVNAPDTAGSISGTVMSMLKNAELTVDGIYQLDPMQTELTLALNLKGDMAMTFTIPMVMTKEKLYVKVPSIPMLPIPETVVGKYVELDLKELAAEEGASFNLDAIDPKKTQKLTNEITSALFTEYDGAKYFKDVPVKDANLPEGVESEQVAQFSVTNDNVKEAITILVEKVLPNILTIVDKEEYREMLGLTTEEIKKVKDELNTANKDEFNKGLEELKSYLKVNTFNVNTAINKKGFATYQDLVMNIELNDPETKQDVKLALKGSSQYSKINEKQAFKIGIPAKEDVLTMEQFQQEIGN